MTRDRIGALVLAGGSGRRAAPQNKLLTQDPSGQTMIARTIQAVAGSRVDAVLLVLGHDAERIRSACPGIAWAFADDHAEGIAASLRCGVAHAARAGWDALLICLGDMPLIAPGTINMVLDAWRREQPRPDAVLPVSAGRRGNPVLWDRRMFPSLLELGGDAGARSLLDHPQTVTVAVEVGDAAVLEDFDTPARLALFEAGLR